MEARIGRSRCLARRIVGECVGARIGEARQLALAAAFARLSELVVILGGRGDQRLALRVGDERRSDADRAAGVEDVDHGPGVGGIDPQRGVRLAGRRAADQQRQLHLGALHLAGDRHHLVERGRDQARKADHLRFVVVGRLQDVLPRDHHAKVDHLETVALQDHADDVLADVVDVALDGGHDDPALALGGALFSFSFSMKGKR